MVESRKTIMSFKLRQQKYMDLDLSYALLAEVPGVARGILKSLWVKTVLNLFSLCITPGYQLVPLKKWNSRLSNYRKHQSIYVILTV